MAAVPSALFSVQTLPNYTPLQPQAEGRAAGAPCRQPGTKQPPARLRPATATADSAWVRTDEDVVTYFETHGTEAHTQYFFCLPMGSGGGKATGWEALCGADGPGTDGTEASAAAASEFFLRVVPPEAVAHAPLYFVISPRQVVRVEPQRGGGSIDKQRHTETLPLQLWLGHKRAFLSLRRLTFFQCFSLAKCWAQWRSNARNRVLRRRRQALQLALMPACPAFGGALLAAQEALEGRLRAVRVAAVHPGRRYTTEEWVEQQTAWRARKVQPEVDEAVGDLVRTAEAAVQLVEAEASEFERTVLPAELTDRIGVDLYAATTKARARSMQQIKREKIERAAAYHRALAERTQVPRFLRLLDLRLRAALVDMAAASVASAAEALRAAAPRLPLHHAVEDRERLDSEADEEEEAATPGSHRSAAGGGLSARNKAALPVAPSPPFYCSVVFGEDGSIGFSPSEEVWTAAVESEVVSHSLHLAGNVPSLLSLPAFERHQEAAGVGQAGQESVSQVVARQETPLGPADLAREDGVFAAAHAQLRALLAGSYTRARRLVQRYHQYLEIQRFGVEFEFESWAAKQRHALDLEGTDALLHRLRSWQEQVEGMPLAGTAGLLHVDATGLQAQLAPIVTTAQDRCCGLLLQLAGERCREVLQELSVWREVAAGRPPELDGFLGWSAELATMQAGMGEQLVAAGVADAGLELVVTYAGKLPTADAVKRDDLREALQLLPQELAAAAEWAQEQCVAHITAVEQQAAMVVEEAILLESELQVGQYVDPGSPLGEVLADLELAGARTAQLTAQAEELAQVQAALGAPVGEFLEVREAEAALQRRSELWHLIEEAEALRVQLAQLAEQSGPGEQGQEAGALPEGAGAAASALHERLGALRGKDSAPDAVWVRASTSVHVCRMVVQKAG